MEWQEKSGLLSRRFEFENFAEALAFVNQIGEVAEGHNHHPDIKFGWGYVEVNLTSHDAGVVTEKDHQLAEAIDQLLNR